MTFLIWLLLGVVWVALTTEVKYRVYEFDHRLDALRVNIDSILGWIAGGAIGYLVISLCTA